MEQFNNVTVPSGAQAATAPANAAPSPNNETRLIAFGNRLSNIEANMATRADLANMATKADLQGVQDAVTALTNTVNAHMATMSGSSMSVDNVEQPNQQ